MQFLHTPHTRSRAMALKNTLSVLSHSTTLYFLSRGISDADAMTVK